MDFSKIADKFVSKVDGIVFDMQTNKIGFKDDDGIVTFDATTKKITINPITQFAIDIPGLAMQTPIAQIRSGDILVQNGYLKRFVVDVVKGEIKAANSTGTKVEVIPPDNLLFGGSTAMIIKNFFCATGEGNAPMGGMNPMMMMAMMGGDDNKKFNPLMMMAMMNGGFGAPPGDGAANPMMMMLMMKDGGPFA